jgi:hypothetical protein
MSYRTANKLGEHAATGDGGEGSPIETDPLGGNVGTHTPFILLTIPYDPEYPEMQPYNNGYSPPSNFSSLYGTLGSRIADLPGFGTNWGSFGELAMAQYEESVWNAQHGLGFNTNEGLSALIRSQLGLDIYLQPGARVTGFGVNLANGGQVGGTWDLDKALAAARDGGVSLFATWEDSWSFSEDNRQMTAEVERAPGSQVPANPANDPPKCTVSVSDKGPQVGGEMELPGGTNLGPVSELGVGFRVQMEITARFVGTFPHSVMIRQNVSSRSNVWNRNENVVRQNFKIDDDTNPDRQYYDKENGLAYSNDAPGIGQSPEAELEATGMFQGNFTSWVDVNGKKICSVDWHMSISAIYGRITSVNFGNGHIQF